MPADLIDLAPSRRSMKEDVLEGLTATRKWLSPKYFYDRQGSALFDEICELPEYYPTRTEMGIMQEFGPAIASAMGPGSVVVEFGSGSSAKVRLLFDMLTEPRAYVPIDISKDHLKSAADGLADDFPNLEVMAICADFTGSLDLNIRQLIDGRLVGFFPGSTIGNFSSPEAKDFLQNTAALLGTGGGLLIGVDLHKDTGILEAAYNDAKGVTAAFNLNILSHINRELDANFDLKRFRHRAFYNPDKGRVEMHLVSTHDQDVRVAETMVPFAKGETIHTENSYKYSLDGFKDMARSAGYSPRQCWTDENRLFSVHFLEVA